MSGRRLGYPLAVVALLAQMAFAMVTTAVQQSPTIDEPVYVATAEVYRQQHSLRYNPEHPPLGKLVMAAGLAFADARLDPEFRGDQTALGRHLLYESGNDPYRLLLLARLPVILLTLLFGLVVLAFARDLAGPVGGLLALALYAFSPDVIAHGSLATLDVPAAGFLLTAFWLAWRGRQRRDEQRADEQRRDGQRRDGQRADEQRPDEQRPDEQPREGLWGGGLWRDARWYTPLSGLALGAALATKMSALPAVPLLLLLILLPDPRPGARPGNAPGWGDRLAAAATAGVLAVAVVWLSYLAVDPRLRWTTPPGLPDVGGLRGLAVALLPLPRPYRDGMLVQFGFEAQTFNGFLLGHAYRGSPWYYLPTALLIKTPLGLLALWAAGAVTVLRRRADAAGHVLVPAAVLLLVATTGARGFGTRYAIFMPLFLAVAGATVVLVRRRWVRVATAVLVLLVAASSLRTFPYYLPYSNEAFGGPAATHRNLHDANVDWGQDLARLARHLREAHPGEPVWLVYKGSGVPEYYGITARDPLTVPPERVHGLLVVSDSRVALARGPLRHLIDTSARVGAVGHSITIYRRP